MKVKICCIQDIGEAELAMAAGAWALGLVADMPSGQGPIDDDTIAAIAAAVGRRAETFLLTRRTEADGIIAHHRRCGTTAVQLVDHVPHQELRRLRSALPGVSLAQVIHVRTADSVREALAVAPLVDYLLLDSGNPDLEVKELGGTGRVHDWRLSRAIVRGSPVPVFLAGGLGPGNVRAGIEQVSPQGVDLCSGIRDADGRLLPDALAAFMGAVRSGAT